MRITRVVTKTGDGGETTLAMGRRISKGSLRVAAYGDADELNSLLGVVRAHLHDERLDTMCETLQHQLFVVGADLATPPEHEGTRVEQAEIDQVEAFLDELMQVLDPLSEFVLPGGGPAGSFLQLARAVARRMERSVVTLSETEAPTAGNPPVSHELLVYINRLSDLLFVMARVANHREGARETLARFSKNPRRTTGSLPAAPAE